MTKSPMPQEAATQSTQPRRSIVADMAARYGMDPQAFEATLRATVMPPTASREEFAAFCVVAREFGLNPITREIFAMQKQGGGLQPIVSVDGWANILNSHPQFDGLDFIDHTNAEGIITAITCRIHRKDRAHPIESTEYLVECNRNTQPWKQWPRRMLRHKAMIQAARYAFGFAGIIDADEAARYAAPTTPPDPAWTTPVPPRRDMTDQLTALASARRSPVKYKPAAEIIDELDAETGEVIDQGEYAPGDDELPLEKEGAHRDSRT